jgi:capsid portal protein
MGELTTAQEGTHLDKYEACSNHSRDCNRMLRQVGHHYGNPIWVLKSEALKVGRKMPRFRLQRFKRAIHAHASIGDAMGMLTQTRFQKIYKGRVAA